MKVSLNSVKQFTAIDIPVEQLVEKINQQLGGVEDVINLGARYKGAVIAKVVECEKHPNADKLSVCKIEAGTGELIQVVCGAPNVRDGIYVVWLPPGVTVPSSFDEKEPIVLGARELRGVMSNGMLASPKELALGESHDGILELTDTDMPENKTLAAGQDFAETFGLDDTIIDIENKMFTHRPDLFGQIGVAREIAGIQHIPFTSPDWYIKRPTFITGKGLELRVINEATTAVPRFMAVAVRDVTVKPSPVWLQAELIRLGGKPINNIVDATNYIMLLTAQPTHAYDYDKLRGHTIGARMAHSGESVKLLNHKSYILDAADVVIVDGEGPVGLAGIMGGGDSEVSDQTKNIVLEVANFDMYTLRRSSMRHGVFTDALTRFNKGQSPLQNDRLLDSLLHLILSIGGGEAASDVFDQGAFSDSYHNDDNRWAAQTVSMKFINERLGTSLTDQEAIALLENVEFQVHDMGDLDEICINPPFWRTDIELPEDIIEEVGRLYGFDKLPRELPRKNLNPATKNATRVLKQTIRDSLSRTGANELLTYSFVNENIIKKAQQDPTEAYKLSNALSPDLQYYRLSVLPSLLDKVHANIKAGYDEFTLFEIGKGHNVHNVSDNLPSETDLIELIYASKKELEGAAFYRAKRHVSQLLDTLGIDVSFQSIEQPMPYAGMVPYEHTRSALVVAESGTILGIVGELKAVVRAGFKLPEYTAAATLDISMLSSAQNLLVPYQPLSRYPSTWQDLCFKVSDQINYTQLKSSIRQAVKEEGVTVTIAPIDIYQGADTTDRQLTFRVTMTDYNQTIHSDTVKRIIDKIIKKAQQDCSAVII